MYRNSTPLKTERPGRSAPEGAAEPAEALPFGIEGLDVAQGLMLCAERPDLYLKMLAMFCDSHRADAERLRALAGGGQHEALRHLAHRLKGGASTIGATELAATAQAVQRAAMDQRPDAAAQARGLAGALERLLAQLEGAGAG